MSPADGRAEAVSGTESTPMETGSKRQHGHRSLGVVAGRAPEGGADWGWLSGAGPGAPTGSAVAPVSLLDGTAAGKAGNCPGHC